MNNYGKYITMLLVLSPALVWAQAATAPDNPISFNPYDALRYILAGIAFVLVIAIILLANAVKNAGVLYTQQQADNKEKGSISNTLKIFLWMPFLVLCLGSSFDVYAQDTAAKAATDTPATSPWAQVPFDIYIALATIAIEFVVLLYLSRWLFRLLGVDKRLATQATTRPSFFQRFNQTVAIEKEHTIDLAHDYDGIRELDNKVPGWWAFGFYASILFSGVYLYQMFISGNMPKQLDELRVANEVAAVQRTEYLKKAASNIDENNVKMLDAAGIAAGKALFVKPGMCASCHGEDASGIVNGAPGAGPNLVDDYWVHKGGLKDIFYSIKYGWPEKGMKSWKEDFSPIQIAELSSYIKSLQGTKLPHGKEKQGELYVDDTATSTAAAPADSTAATNPVQK